MYLSLYRRRRTEPSPELVHCREKLRDARQERLDFFNALPDDRPAFIFKPLSGNSEQIDASKA